MKIRDYILIGAGVLYFSCLQPAYSQQMNEKEFRETLEKIQKAIKEIKQDTGRVMEETQVLEKKIKEDSIEINDEKILKKLKSEKGE